MNRNPLHFNSYASDIELFSSYCPDSVNLSDRASDWIIEYLIKYLKPEWNSLQYYFPVDKLADRDVLKALLTISRPFRLEELQHTKLDQLLQSELLKKKITTRLEINNLAGYRAGRAKMLIWKGDITCLETDAIVNAANNQMLGCFQPLHACIDNAIHSASGPRLRDDCALIMQKQGFNEPVGTAKITRAYNLPSNFVLHTVGPIVKADETEQNRLDLSKAYTSCLAICDEIEEIRSLAFCCISTGVYGYPGIQAARVAVSSVRNWLQTHPDSLEKVIFNVYTDRDRIIYENFFKQL